MWCIKQLLGVRGNTCIKTFVFKRTRPAICMCSDKIQAKKVFLTKSEIKNMTDDLWAPAVRVILDCNFPTAHYIRDQINNKKLAINGIK